MLFRWFLCTKLVSTLFAWFSVDFSGKIDASSLVFFNIATLTEHCILQYESYFFIFRVFVFFLKKIVEKRVPKSRPRFSLKNHPKVVFGDPFWDPKRSRINVGEINKPKNSTKKSFLGRAVFWIFFKSKKLLGLVLPKWAGPQVKLKNYVSV